MIYFPNWQSYVLAASQRTTSSSRGFTTSSMKSMAKGIVSFMVAGRVSFGRPFVWLLLVAVQDRRNSAHRRISITAKDISKLAKKMIRVGAELGKLKWEINKLYEKAPRT